ncbi:unnamed protein product [Trichogramma brassicae]|uniref:RING-type domain-containing protein n=1 Tax=Trichogramma brassicae TaxID=86971 RepID=A0A6H5IVJ3_9HYME|nr:unnamed protein product [Trichogramma brassicae]
MRGKKVQADNIGILYTKPDTSANVRECSRVERFPRFLYTEFLLPFVKIPYTRMPAIFSRRRRRIVDSSRGCCCCLTVGRGGGGRRRRRRRRQLRRRRRRGGTPIWRREREREREKSRSRRRVLVSYTVYIYMLCVVRRRRRRRRSSRVGESSAPLLLLLLLHGAHGNTQHARRENSRCARRCGGRGKVTYTTTVLSLACTVVPSCSSSQQKIAPPQNTPFVRSFVRSLPRARTHLHRVYPPAATTTTTTTTTTTKSVRSRSSAPLCYIAWIRGLRKFEENRKSVLEEVKIIVECEDVNKPKKDLLRSALRMRTLNIEARRKLRGTRVWQGEGGAASRLSAPATRGVHIQKRACAASYIHAERLRHGTQCLCYNKARESANYARVEISYNNKLIILGLMVGIREACAENIGEIFSTAHIYSLGRAAAQSHIYIYKQIEWISCVYMCTTTTVKYTCVRKYGVRTVRRVGRERGERRKYHAVGASTTHTYPNMDGISKRRTYLREVKPHLICPLCRGYLIDATTVVECLHSFCRSCIIKHLKREAQCPSCKQLLNTAKPNIKADKTLQDIVYKLVPGLYQLEMKRRREFYSKHPDHVSASLKSETSSTLDRLQHAKTVTTTTNDANLRYIARQYHLLSSADATTPEQRGEDVSGRLIFAPEDAISLSLEYLPTGADPLLLSSSMDYNNDIDSSGSSKDSAAAATPDSVKQEPQQPPKQQQLQLQQQQSNDGGGGAASNLRRYLQCPALVTIAHLKKFLALKYNVDVTRFNIDICHRRASLPDHWTLMDVAYIFAWKRNAPIQFFYRITQEVLEAPTSDRPSTPGLGATQPLTEQEAAKTPCADPEPEPVKPIPNLKPLPEFPVIKSNSSSSSSVEKPQRSTSPNKRSSSGSPKDHRHPHNNHHHHGSSKSSPPNLIRAEEAMKQVKSPIKIMKNSEGRYQVLRTDTPPGKTSPVLNEKIQSAPPAEFSVVSIGDGANSNGSVKITLKQCTPSNSSNNNAAAAAGPKKPKVITNTLLKSSDHVNRNAQGEKMKRKVSFEAAEAASSSSSSGPTPAKQAKRPENDKKQFLHSFRLTAKNGQEGKTRSKEAVPSVEEQVRNIIRNGEANRHLRNSLVEDSPTKKRPETTTTTTTTTTTKPISTNIADRLGDPKVVLESKAESGASGDATSDQSPVDVYTFPSSPPVPVPVGAVKRKCPPGLPISEMRKKQSQLNFPSIGKKTTTTPVSSPKVSGPQIQQPTPTKPTSTPKTSPALFRVGINQTYLCSILRNKIFNYYPLLQQYQQSVPKSTSSSGNSGQNSSPVTSQVASAVTTFCTPTNAGKNSVTISTNTRNILDKCGLTIPPSLSITLSGPETPSQDSPDNRPQPPSNLNPSITLNDTSVDTRVLKALKSGQIRLSPVTNFKHSQQSFPKKEDSPVRRSTPSPKNVVGANSPKNTPTPKNTPGGRSTPTGRNTPTPKNTPTLKIPTPASKLKTKSPPNWVRVDDFWSIHSHHSSAITVIFSLQLPIYPKPSKDMSPNFGSGQFVTLQGGQKFYRAPPGSLTPAANRFPDMPPPPRAPVYAPVLSSAHQGNSRPGASFANILQNFYAANQAPKLEPFNAPGKKLQGPPMASKEVQNSAGKTHIGAQCVPIKPSRTGPVAVPKSHTGVTIKAVTNSAASAAATAASIPALLSSSTAASSGLKITKVGPPAKENDNTTSESNTNKTKEPENKEIKVKESNQASIKTEQSSDQSLSEQSDKCSSSSVVNEQDDSHRESASPRVTSTASPTPPTTTENCKTDNKVKPEKPISGSEVTSSNKSPESPDSSSGVEENATDNSNNGKTIPNDKTDKTEKTNGDKTEQTKSETQLPKIKEEEKSEQSEITKSTSSTLQQRFLAAFPSDEWSNNPAAAERFGDFLKSLSTMQ